MSTAIASSKGGLRGLNVFITDVRAAQNKEEEEKRVNKEMAKIRKKFKEAKEVDGYARKKYVSKLMYIYMLGYELDFGYIEAVNLLSATKFSEKCMGYLALSLLLHENHEMLPLVIQSLQNDIQSRNDFHQSLALCAIANIGSKEMGESLSPIVQKLLTAKATKPIIKKKSALCLLRLYRKFPESLSSESWSDRILLLLDEPDLGSLTSTMGLLLGLAQENPKPFESATNKVILLLSKIVLQKEISKDYYYYNVANPWLQVKLLQFLSLYPSPEDSTLKGKLQESLRRILSSADSAKNQATPNHKNALHCVLFEAISLVVHLDDDRELIRTATTLLAKFVLPKEHSNIRYLALSALGTIASLDNESSSLVTKHQETVLQALRDVDISIRKRALDLLYGMCDKANAKTIVSELLLYLASADFAIKEELVLKIAILAEKFASDYSWYVDVIFQLVNLAGDFVTDDIWFRVVQIVTNHEDIQEYAAKTVLSTLQQPDCHEVGVKLGGYILGEFGHLIADNPSSSPLVQFKELQSKFSNISDVTKSLLLSTYVKFVNVYPELSDTIKPVFQSYQTSFDAELQQRAFEYSRISLVSDDLMQTVLDAMPQFTERTVSEEDSRSPEKGRSPKVTASSSSSQPSSSSSRNLKNSDLISISDQPSLISDLPQNVSTTPVNTTSTPAHIAPQQQTPVQVNQPKEVVPDALKRNTLITEGVLHQDQYIQIGFKSEYSNNGHGRMMIYYGNSSPSPFLNFRTSFSSVPFLSINAPPMNPTLDSRAQAQQLVTMSSSLAEFNAFPTLDVSFLSNGNPIQVQIKLPVTLIRFVEQTKISGPDFYSQWKQIENPPQSLQSVVKSSKPIDLGYVNKVLTVGLSLTVLPNVDPNLNNIVGTGSYVTSTSKTPFLFRLESNAAAEMFRVSVKSPHPLVASGIMRLLEIHLS
eukprot:TRINITY_DN898_c0_g1_i1.p1 TRINITY_DN898_c0_g1~~TRINITY_DN898_c0_g1_i1.p1  ORF type:complete len:933 (+),score=327.40 TRINITY_DN898_c0_g1_i1:186-2984(+)